MDAAPDQILGKKSHGAAYWLARHIKEWCAGHLQRHAGKFVLGLIVAGVAALFSRAYLHHYVLWVRVHFFLVLIGAPALWLWWRLLSRGRWWRRLAATAIGALLAWPIAEWGDDAHEFASLWRRHRTLKIVDLNELPITGHERIHPRNGIHSLAFEAMGEVLEPTIPNYVRLHNGAYDWTMAVEPATLVMRMFHGIDELLSVSGTTASPNFSSDNRVRARFETSEGGYFGRNVNTAVIKTFSPWRFFHFEPKGVAYLTDDRGRWIQAVKFIRWTGVIFPRPEFGGIQVIGEGHENAVGWLKRIFLGIGTWVPPEEIRRYPYLVGQNLVPYEVTRYAAESFRFQEGFLAPLPGYHVGDIRIPDQAEDQNPQPFAIYVEGLPKEPGQFVHYFGLEPFGPERQATNTSLYIPGDGHAVVYAYRHQRKGESFPGVSTVATKVMESKKMYTWGPHLPVEHRPFVRMINGKIRFFWLTTVVTRKTGAQGEGWEREKRFIAGGSPEVAITFPGFNRIVWVDPAHPESWVKEIEKGLAPVWSMAP